MLFESTLVGSVQIRNRIVKGAMVEGMADERSCALPALVSLYERWARGGVGLAITGMTMVQPKIRFTPKELGFFDDCQIAPFARVARAVHENGAKLFVQLSHAGPQITRRIGKVTGSKAPSAGYNRLNGLRNQALTGTEIWDIIDAFGAAAVRARLAGADGVQLHAAHGYLLSRFISPRHNRRVDDWGCTPAGRLRILVEIRKLIAAKAGADFPVAVKLNAHDGQPQGMILDHGIENARILAEAGFDAIEVSAGTMDVALGFYPDRGEVPTDLGKELLRKEFPRLGCLSGLAAHALRRVVGDVSFREAYFENEARRIAEAVRVPVWASGGIRGYETAERIVSDSDVKMVALARPFVREPNLVNKWQSQARRAASCRSCNRCLLHACIGRQSLKCSVADGEART